jgi:3-hydroxyacyl-CoA dehydrogenase
MTITHVGIIGAGQMGNGIAQVCVAAGLTVTLATFRMLRWNAAWRRLQPDSIVW